MTTKKKEIMHHKNFETMKTNKKEITSSNKNKDFA